MQVVPQQKNKTGQVGGDSGTPDTVKTTDSQTATEVKAADSQFEPDRTAARFAVNVQASITQEAANLFDQYATAVRASSDNELRDLADDIERARAEITATLDRLRDAVARVASRQADGVGQMAGALRSLSGS